MRRQRTQTSVDSPRYLARFINHASEMQRLPQSAFATSLGQGASPATVSRLFRGEVAPNERDLHAFAEVLAVPLETLMALKVLDSISDRRMMATTGLLSYMCARTKTLLMAGYTMGMGVSHLRGARAVDTSAVILVDVVAPSLLPAIEHELLGWNAGDAVASWVSVARTLIMFAAGHSGCRIRLWGRGSLHVDEAHDSPTGELVANDWFAIESPPPFRPAQPFQVHFYGDRRWLAIVDPLKKQLAEERAFGDRRLIWDSLDPESDARFRKLLREQVRTLSALDVRRGPR